VTDFTYVNSASPSGLLRLAEAARVASAIRGGALAVLPTETGYALAALATAEDAVLKAFRVKRRELGNPMHVACASLDMARECAEFTPLAARLLGELTPGPLTVVVPQTARLPERLVTIDGTVGIRVPDHPATLQIISVLGAPVTATSLNRAGEPAGRVDPHELEQLSWPPGEAVYVVRDDAAIRFEAPSTLVRLTGAVPEILRTGPISATVIARVSGLEAAAVLGAAPA
jgi:L-threonylcarbamoyladenylate synthase